MSIIYMIYNDINDLKYVGCTNKSAEERFKVHKNDSKRNKFSHRLLYNDMIKFGYEHFFIKELEEVDEKEKFSREEYWIKEMDSYHNGYNMNLGGKSKKVLDYKKIIDLYKNTNENQKTIALECDCSTDSVKNIVSLYIDKPEWKTRNTVKIRCIDLNKDFNSIADASKFILDNKMSKSLKIENIRITISRVLRKERKSAFGMQWEKIK